MFGLGAAKGGCRDSVLYLKHLIQIQCLPQHFCSFVAFLRFIPVACLIAPLLKRPLCDSVGVVVVVVDRVPWVLWFVISVHNKLCMVAWSLVSSTSST